MSQPLSTPRLIERAATASTEPDRHHVATRYHAERALRLVGPHDHDLAADVAALEMAHAAASVLARRLRDSTDPRVGDFLYDISTHYARQLENLLADMERTADTVTP